MFKFVSVVQRKRDRERFSSDWINYRTQTKKTVHQTHNHHTVTNTPHKHTNKKNASNKQHLQQQRKKNSFSQWKIGITFGTAIDSARQRTKMASDQ